ncbi:ankyrin repeat domain-containing protein [bacterium]|nr:MAG: ankyrin repeat domain-containing protein [bacterium]
MQIVKWILLVNALVVSCHAMTNVALKNEQLIEEVTKGVHSNLKNIEQLIQDGADVNVQDSDGYTPLHSAVNAGVLPLVQLLLNKGAKIDIKNNDGDTPVHIAVVMFKTDAILNLLLSKNPDISIKNNANETPFDLAELNSKKSAIKNVLNQYASHSQKPVSSVESESSAGDSSTDFASLTKEQAQQEFSKKLQRALMLGDAFTERELDGLIKAGANINMPIDISGKGAKQYLVPLLAVAQSGMVDLVKLLLKNGADSAVRDAQGHTAFDLALTDEIKQLFQKQPITDLDRLKSALTALKAKLAALVGLLQKMKNK